MTELVFYAFFLVSLAMGGGEVAVFKTEAECQSVLAQTAAIIAEKAPQVGDAVYLSPCQPITLKSYGKPA